MRYSLHHLFIVAWCITATITHATDIINTEIFWDWNVINPAQISFPPHFLFGTGTSEYQVSGSTNCPHANWAYFEQQKDWLRRPHIAHDDHSGKACDHWNHYQEDIQLMKQLGVNAYRFSIEWSCIEPQEGVFDQAAINHYHDLCNALLANNITPMVTLHHFTHPQWFEEKGAFAREENIKYFVRFCKKMFSEFHTKIPFWLTINEPGVLAFQGYIRGVYPPARCNLAAAGEVTKNLMRAHVAVYRALKHMPGGQQAQIGIVHDIIQWEPYHPGNRLEYFVTWYLNLVFHEAITQFLITKNLQFKIPLLANVTYQLEDPEEKILDFIGLNYYSHVLFNWQWPVDSSYRPGDIPTDMPYGIYPEGLYRAIASVARMGVPIYITENGIADGKDTRRELYVQHYLYALSQAIKDGYDVRGYFYWSLIDNFEWDFGFEKRYGLYEVNYATQERTLRPSAQYLKSVIAQFTLN